MLNPTTLACATLFATLLIAIITGLIGAWLGILFADALARASFDLLPI